MARKAETLEKQKTAELVALKQKKAVAKESLLRKNAQQKHRQELSKYILPTQLGDYIAHPIPQNHPLFTYSAKIDELMHRYHTNQTRQASYDKQVQEAKEAEQDLLYIAEQGRAFLEQHPEQCECPLCHTRFESWNLLYGATLKLERSQKEQLEEEARQIQQETKSIDIAYLRIRQGWLSEYENLIKKEDEICAQYDNAFLVAEQRKRSTEEHIKVLEQEEQDIHLNATGLGWNWKQPLTVKEVENELLEQNKNWKKEENECMHAKKNAGAAAKESSGGKAEC